MAMVNSAPEHAAVSVQTKNVDSPLDHRSTALPAQHGLEGRATRAAGDALSVPAKAIPEAQARKSAACCRTPRGTAFQAVHTEGRPGELSRLTDFPFVPYNAREVVIRYSAYLPHWQQEGATYAVTFRLADSLPRGVLERLLLERNELVRRAAAAGRTMTTAEHQRLRELHRQRVEDYLDRGRGSCVLKNPSTAAILRSVILYFDGERYDIVAWCIMPNHVHVVVRPRPGQTLSRIVHSWKSYSSNQINKVLCKTGSLWQPDWFDHLVRNRDDLERSIRYVLDNPRAAGLRDWPWLGCGTDFEAERPTGQAGREP